MADIKRQGLLVLISGPSGVGKGTVVAELLKQRTDCKLSVSATTRAPREGEIEGQSYFFISREVFSAWVSEGRFLEWDEHFGNCYGTPLDFVTRERASGHHVILEIDVVGASEVKKQVPDAVGIFIAPPSLAELKHRLINRGSEDESQIQTRLERVDREVSFISHYEYTIINDELETAVAQVGSILDTEMLKTERWRGDGVLKEIFK